MNRIVLLVAAAFATLIGGCAAASEISWKAFSEPTGGYSFQYPGTLRAVVPTGKACAGGICRPTEEVILTGLAGSMTLFIQRGINPKRLGIRQWYESLAGRPLRPSTEVLIRIGGRDAIRRGPLIPGATVEITSGRQISRVSGLLRDDTIFVPMKGGDILTISLRPKSQAGADIFQDILQTIRIPS